MLCITVLLLSSDGNAATPDSLKTNLKYMRADTHKVWMLRDIAFAYQLQDLDSAVHYGQLGYTLAESLRFADGMIWTLYQKAIALELKNETEAAFVVYNTALEIANEIQDNVSKAKLYNAIGVANYYIARYHDAVAFYSKAYALADSVGYQEGVTHALNNLGAIYRLQHRYERALDVYYKSLILKRKELDTVGVVNTLFNIGLAQSYLNKYEQSLQYFREAKSLANQISTEPVDMANIDYGIGVAYYNLDKFELAKTHLLSGMGAPSRQITTESISAISYLGSIDVMENNPQEGFSKIEEAYNLALQTGRLDLLRRILRERAIAANAAGKPQTSFESWQEYALITDSIHKVHYQWAQEEMQARFELREKNLTIALQELQLEQESKRTQWYLMFGVAVAILFVSSAIYLYLLWNQRGKLFRTMEQKEIALSNNEFLIREMHHRTKNNLQLLMSLLNIQVRNADNPAALKSLQTIANSVNALSLIHHQLYRNRDIRKISLNSYFRDLFRYFNDAFALEERNISLKLKATDMDISIDKAIPIGLIINELITNALKHAFHGQANGLIEVRLAQQNGRLLIEVEDNGVGYETGNERNGTGNVLLKVLGEKLDGNFEIMNPEQGMLVKYSVNVH